ncbi:MAG: Amuc_1098 family type IV pilus outer membrane protein, partial [Fimbriimonadaceae bacterium]
RLVLNRNVLFALAVSSCFSFAIAGPGGVSSIAEREIARRMARQEDAHQALERGDKAYAQEDYETALSEYKGAIDALPNAPMTQELRDLANAKYADCSVALARDRAKNGRYAEANELLKGALAINPDHKGAKTFMKQLDDPDRFPRALTPEHVVKVQEVERGLEKSNSFRELGDFDKSLAEYQDVLRKDPYNKAARRGMERVEQLRSEYFDSARDHTRAAMIAKVDEEWETKVPVQGLDVKVELGLGTQPSAYIKDKMERIIFPQVSFTGATVEEAIEFLRVKSKDLDTLEKNMERKGVNIIMKTGDTPISAQITLDLRDVPMAEALRYITELAGMKFKIEPYAVLVVPLSETTSEQYTRIYRVPPDFLSLGGGEAGGGAPAAAAPADPFAAGGGAAAGGGSALIRRQNALEILKGQGIQFPEGASAVFNKVTSQLIVKNTQPNLDLVEAFVQSIIDQKPKMIYITSKFVEVSQKNTDELGFDWLLGPFNIASSERVFGSGGSSGNSSNGATPADYPFTSSGTTIGTNPVTAGNRSGSSAINADSIDGLLAGGNVASSLAPGILAFSGVFTDPQFQVVIRALSQKKGVDLMSAPSVTTKSGQVATVEVVREFLYPTEFDPPEIPQTVSPTQTTSLLGGGGGSSSSFPVTPTTPTTFEMKPIGVRMEAEPTVGADGYTIDLRLAPEVTEFEGFVNYGSPISTSGSDALGNPTTLVLTENKIEQPVFSSRKLSTSVTVFDGATVVMGGLIREDVQDVEDKVPLLGDIPILGRLFQTKAEDHFKRNLMIFVTATLIDPSGAKIRLPAAPVSGIPEDALSGPNPILPPAVGP